MAKGNHSFAEQDIHSRFNAIVGHTVAEVDTAGVLTASSASRNKGRVGAVIERSVLGYPADSDRRPDILIDGQPWEVKVTGLVEVARGGWRAKEPMSITAVAPEGIVAESFTTSAFWHKAARLLVVYYLYVRPGRGVAVEYAGFEFKGYDLHTWREVDRCRLEADWTPRVTPKTGIPMTAPNWPKSRDGVLFVRGTGTDANDKPVTVNGVRMYRQNVWIKGKELVGQLDAVRFL